MNVPWHKNIDRYMISRVISDYDKNRQTLEKLNAEKNDEGKRTSSDYRYLFCKTLFLPYESDCESAYTKRLKEECAAVEAAQKWASARKNSDKYTDFLKLTYKDKLPLHAAARKTGLSEYECRNFLNAYRAIVSMKLGRVEFRC